MLYVARLIPLFLISVSLLSCIEQNVIGNTEDEYCRFFPVVFQNSYSSPYVLKSKIMNENERNILKRNILKRVFEKYDIPFKLNESGFFIPCVYMGDIEFISNLTSKSEIDFN